MNDEGEEVEFDVIAGINYKDDFYLILLPTSIPNAPEDEAFVFKCTEYEDGDAEYEFIDDDEILKIGQNETADRHFFDLPERHNRHAQ